MRLANTYTTIIKGEKTEKSINTQSDKESNDNIIPLFLCFLTYQNKLGFILSDCLPLIFYCLLKHVITKLFLEW